MTRVSDTLKIDVVKEWFDDENEWCVWLSNDLRAGWPAYAITGDGELIVRASEIEHLIEALANAAGKIAELETGGPDHDNYTTV